MRNGHHNTGHQIAGLFAENQTGEAIRLLIKTSRL